MSSSSESDSSSEPEVELSSESSNSSNSEIESSAQISPSSVPVAGSSAVFEVNDAQDNQYKPYTTHTVDEDAVVSGIPYFAPASDSSESESDHAPPIIEQPIEIISDSYVPEKKKKKKVTKDTKSPRSKPSRRNIATSTDSDSGYPGTIENAPEPFHIKVEVRAVNADFIASGTAFPIKINLPNGETKEIVATLDFTLRELMESLMHELGMWQYEIWSLSRRGKDGDGCKAVCLEGGKYTNITVNWLDLTKTVEETGIGKGEELYLRIKYFKYYFKLRDKVSIDLYYAQIKAEVLSGFYPVSGSKVTVRLAALQLQVQTGDFNRAKHKPGYFTDETLLTYLPKRVLERNSSEYIQQRIFFYHRRLVGTRKDNAQLAYIVESRNMSTWGATWFDCKLNHYQNQPSRRMVIGVCEDGFVLPLKAPVSEEDEKQKTVSRRKFLESARTNSIMQLGNIVDVTDLGKLQQKTDDDQYEFFKLSTTYLEETKLGLLLKKKGEKVELGMTKNQINQLLSLVDSYIYILTKQGSHELNESEIETPADDCPDYRLFERPVDRSEKKKEKKAGKTMLELFKENYLEASTVASKKPVPRLLLQIEAKLDEKSVLDELDVRRCELTDQLYQIISESIGATFSISRSAGDVSFKQDLVPSALLLSYNDLRNPPELGDMASSLRVSKIDLRSNNLSPKWAATFAKALVKCTSLVEIDLSDNRIGNDGAIDIVNSLISLPALRAVSLSNVGMENGAMKRSISKISHGPDRGTMRGLVGGPGPEMGKVIASLLVSATKLERLDVSDNVLASRGVEFIVDALEKNDDLRARLVSLNLGNTHISGSVGERLSSWLLKTVNDSRNHLEVLDLNANAFTSPACTMLCDLFAAVTIHLTQVDFSHLKMHVGAISTLFMAVASVKTLKQLSLANNNVTSKNAEFIGPMIENNTSLIQISFRNCAMDKTSLQALGKALSKNSTLTDIDCAGNDFESAAACTAWSNALKNNSALTKLNLAACNIDGDALETLAQGFRASRSLEILALDANYLGSRGLKKLGHAVKANAFLRILSLQDVDCKYKDTGHFIQEISEDGSVSGLRTLDVRHNRDLTQNAAFIDVVKAHPKISIRFTPRK